MRFIIAAPKWNHKSAGIKVLHRLCHILNTLGVDAKVTSEGNPAWLNPVHDPDEIITDDVHVIYPEIVCENPLEAKRVIRYMLYYPWHHFAGQRIAPNELVIPYSKWVLFHTQGICDYPVTDRHILELSIIEPDLFFDNPKIQKTMTTFWVYKSNLDAVRKFPFPAEAFPITQDFSREQVAGLLQRSRTFISFDVNSCMNQEAYQCGAEVFLVTEKNQVIPFKGKTWAENNTQYHDTLAVKRFLSLVEEFPF
jgi:hypothetical protein